MTGSAPRSVLGWVAGVLAAIAPIAGSPYAAAHARVDVAQLADAVAREDDHVTAIELAQWIKDRRPDLRVIDVRAQADFDAFHIPTAERVPIDAITTTPFDPRATIVLYSDGGAHAAQAWVFLRALGYRQVYFLRGGLYDWLDEVMNPGIAADAPAEARAAFERQAALSRYFGGTPHVIDGAASPAPPEGRVGGGETAPRSTAAAVARIRRRRC